MSLLLAALTLAALSGCAAPSRAGGADAPSPSDHRSLVSAPGDATVTELWAKAPEVHALAVDRSGRLLVATAVGLYRVDTDGTTSLVGSVQLDLVALTVASEGTLLGSARRAPGSIAEPGNDQLLRSVDDGATWSPVASTDRFDAQALAARNQTIVAVDGTGVLASTNAGRTWRRGAAQQVWSIAVDTRTIWATGPTGLQRSDDNGRSFQPVTSAPRLSLATAADDTTPWGADDHGRVWTWSAPSGWLAVASVGHVTAIAALDTHTAFIVGDGHVLRITRPALRSV